jgi:glucosamine-phosphate N-acetyltransferase
MIHIHKDKKGSETAFLVRKINRGDRGRKYLDLLRQLTTIDPEKISEGDFNKLVDGMGRNQNIIVIEDVERNIVIGSATLLVEEKFIHNMGLVGHIEDVVLDSKYRGLNLGKLIIDHLVALAKNRGCYKVILNCEEKNVDFYLRCGFVRKEVEMVKYISPISKL